MNSEIRPLGDRLLVRRIEPMPADFGIWFPESEQPQNFGEVVAVGPGRRTQPGNPLKNLYRNGARRPMQVKPGDRIYYGRFTDKHQPGYRDDGTVFIQEGDIIGIVQQ